MVRIYLFKYEYNGNGIKNVPEASLFFIIDGTPRFKSFFCKILSWPFSLCLQPRIIGKSIPLPALEKVLCFYFTTHRYSKVEKFIFGMAYRKAMYNYMAISYLMRKYRKQFFFEYFHFIFFVENWHANSLIIYSIKS